ncbi:ACP S-malonyltransferase [Oenococcus sicerae]|uniref:ACP S-malonyltransferase n=1 Tax=Oenococcus sicerae TaxID=2203724 RepID=UPI0039EB3997
MAYLFSGQGGKIEPLDDTLYKNSVQFRQIFDDASTEFDTDLWQLWASGDQRLSQTRFAQPAILTLSLALHSVISKQLPDAVALAGLSLGEYSALIAGKGLDWPTGFQLITKRGQLMQDASEHFPGAMAAVMSQDTDLIERVCQEVAGDTGLIVQTANYNYPKQTVIGGEKKAVLLAVGELHKQGIARIVDLPVSGAFHTPLMASANQQFVTELQSAAVSEPEIPVISNTTGQAFTKKTIKETLAKQMVQATRFTDCLLQMGGLGVTTVIELGPGHSLTSFAKKTLKLEGYYAVSDADSLNAAVSALNSVSN